LTGKRALFGLSIGCNECQAFVSKVGTDPVAAACGLPAGSRKSPDRTRPSDEPEPPCKSGQLKKDLGLEVSSARHAARLVIFEFIRSSCIGSIAPVPDGTSRSTDTPCQSEALSRGEPASVPLIRYWLTFPGEGSLDLALRETTGLLGNPAHVCPSSVKDGIHLAGDRRRQFRFQEIKHHEHCLLGVLLADPCSLYNQVYYLFVHGELSARA
jgi:hypothetical protein